MIEQARCMRCKNSLPQGGRYCPHCGARGGPHEGAVLLRGVLIFAYALAAVVLGLFGACSIAMDSKIGHLGFGSGLGLLLFALAAAAFGAMINLVRP